MGITTHNLGFPRIGANRELKFALETYWRGDLDAAALQGVGQELRLKHWQQQSQLSSVPVGDFSFYDQVLDMSFTLGHLPDRFQTQGISPLDNYFRVARGRSTTQSPSEVAGEMTKWFDTNYHYIVPEFTRATQFKLDASRLLAQVLEAQNAGHVAKPVIIGPVSYLWLGKSKDDSQCLDRLEDLLEVYAELLQQLADAGVLWIQVDEPVLLMQLDKKWQQALKQAYHQLRHPKLKLLLCSYFGRLADNLQLACELPVDGLHIDAINACDEVNQVVDWLPVHKVLSLGVINGRNIWKTDLDAALELLEPIYQRLGDRLWLAPSCSLLHVPVDLNSETQLDTIIKSWLAFALQKLDELVLLANILQHGRQAYVSEITEHQSAVLGRRSSDLVRNEKVQTTLAAVTPDMLQRKQSFKQRAALQQQALDLPVFPTTTIGSFPQTEAIRKTRKAYKLNELSDDKYQLAMQTEIRSCIAFQENIGLDVLVHGEAERNDMVEYFGEQLSGYVFTQFAWVQSYGSRCVKPPIIYGDIERKQPMTVEWTKYAQGCSDKPVKGMLTGPVTMLNWSFVRDDQPRAVTCQQLALAIRYEVLDLERAGIKVIQIDEAALREGLPLRRSDWSVYLDWAVAAFRLSANGVADETQIHTHMCYSEFNDIIEAIAAMDADVITIETSRSDMELLSAFENFDYPNQIGPGVYDIHTPNIPNMESIVALMSKAAEKIPAQRLWVNPDCGLKTRSWAEVRPALVNMVKAASVLRGSVVVAA